MQLFGVNKKEKQDNNFVSRRQSQRLNMAAELLDAGDLSNAEFEELRMVDHAYRRELGKH